MLQVLFTIGNTASFVGLQYCHIFLWILTKKDKFSDFGIKN